MTRKALNEQNIVNELKGNSAFFPDKSDTPLSETPSQYPPTLPVMALESPERMPVDTFPAAPISPTETRPQEVSAPKEKNIQKRESDTVVSRHHDTTLSPYPDALIETIRKAVKQLGKEAATHRFTIEEKKALRGIVYTYETQGLKTSENEIARIAIHSLLEDYQENNENSVLAMVLESLNS